MNSTKICDSTLNYPNGENSSVITCSLPNGHEGPHRTEHVYSDEWWPKYGRSGRKFSVEWVETPFRYPYDDEEN